MPNRSQFKPYRVQGGLEKQGKPPEQVYESDNFSVGLVTDINKANIPDNGFSGLKNVQYIAKQCLRRNGLSLYSLAKPDSNEVLALFAFFDVTKGIQFLRFTASSVYRAGSSGWTATTGAGLTGATIDRFSFASADNRGFFSNNGADPIQEILAASNTYAPLGNAPRYKYITSAFNRIIGANRRDVTDIPIEVGWSGDLNYAQWNPITDISAGNTPLVNSPSDTSDDITGLFNLQTVLCIPRQRSIWLATNIPSATNPFYFYNAVPDSGCDVPNTIALGRLGGIFYYNYESSSANFYVPGSQPEDFTGNIRRALKSAIVSPDSMFATYNKDTQTYSIYIMDDNSSLVKSFSFNAIEKVWSYDEFQGVSIVQDIEFKSSTATIDELTGTIDALAGTMDTLGGIPASANRFFGFQTGELSLQPVFPPDSSQVSNIVLTDNGSSFSSNFDSGVKRIVAYEGVYNHLSIGYTPYTTGTVNIYYSKDEGKNWVVWKSITVNSNMLYNTQEILVRKPIRARSLMWRVLSSDCMMSLDSHRLVEIKSGLLTVTNT